MVAASSSRAVLFSALRSGGLVGVLVRPSRVSVSGLVVVPVFSSLPAALRFAARVAAWSGGFPSVRPVAARGAARFGVSVPLAALVPLAGVVAVPARGVRGVAAAASSLAALGF